MDAGGGAQATLPTSLLGAIDDQLTEAAVEVMSTQPQDFRGIGEEEDVHDNHEVGKMRQVMIKIMNEFLGQKNNFMAQKIELEKEKDTIIELQQENIKLNV